MYKNLLKSIAFAALAIVAGACAKEQVAQEGQTGMVTFEVENPVAATKAIGDGTTAKQLYYQVFDAAGNPIAGLPVQSKELTSLKTTVSFQLIKDQKYNFVFWAQTPTSGYYTIDGTEGLKKITANYEGKKSNDENFDAFYAVEKDLSVSGPVNKTVKLTRPFAQVNIGTKDEVKAGTTSASAIDLTDATSKVVVKGVPTVFAPLATTPETMLSGATDVTFIAAAVPTEKLTVKSVEYDYLAMNYVFAPAEGTVSDITAEFSLVGRTPIQLSSPSTPLKRNYRTNIIGKLLTTTADYNIIVVPGFENDLDNINSAGALAALFANGGSGKLMGDVELTEMISVPAGKEVVLNLNGKSIKNTGRSEAIRINGTLKIEGEGTVDGGEGGNNKAVLVANGGELIINGGTFTVGRDADNAGNTCIETWGGNVEIYGGCFRTDVDWNGWYYVLNQKNEQPGTITVYGGRFEKYNPADGDDNLHGTFLAPGYKSTKIGDYYVVTKEDVTPVANDAGFQAAIENAASGETIVLTAPLTLNSTTIVSDKEVNIDLADNTLVLNKNVYTATSNQEAYDSEATGTITFKNGTIECAGAYSLCPFGKGKMELDNVTLTSANDSPLFVKHGSTLIVKNSKINAKYYGITTNASSPNQNVTIVVDNCEITAGEPILVNIPCNLTVTKSTMNGSWHGTVVRGGTATFTDCKIVLDYVDSDAADVAANYNWMGATWGSGNSVTIAALVLGNHAPSAYQYPTNVTLKNTTVACEGVNASLFPSVYSYANQGEGLGVTFNYDASSNLESGKGPVYNSSNIVVNGVTI